jgi:hypothetical protein
MNPDDGIVYHYTSHDAAASIVRNEEMWLTNILYLNDVKEFWGTFDRVREYIQERSTANDPVKVEIVEHVNKFIERRPGTSICVTCFCGHADDARSGSATLHRAVGLHWALKETSSLKPAMLTNTCSPIQFNMTARKRQRRST